MTQTCPTCGSDAAVTSISAPEGGLLFTCFFGHGGVGPTSWQTSGTKVVGVSTAGVTADLVEPFEHILRSLEPALIEYGVLEYRLRMDYPQLFAAHVAARGHVLTGGKQATASAVRFAAALLRLERAGVVTFEMRKPTGAWSYNSVVSFWALTQPAPELGQILTWEAYCAQIGRPAVWDFVVDNQAVTAMAAAATPAL